MQRGMDRTSPGNRRMTKATISAGTLALIALIVATPALAAPAEAPAARAETAPDQGDIILVTARHRAETSQAVPISLTVLGGERIDRTGAFNIDRVQQLTPTLQFYSQNPRNTSLNIRGLGATLGLTNDGIEQGSVGNEGFYQFKGAISGPLSKTVAVRLAVSSTNRDGTIFNATTGHLINAQQNLGGRAQVLWKATDALHFTLAADWNRQNPECCGFVYAGVGTTQRAANRQFGALAATLGYVPHTDPFARIADLDTPLQALNEVGGVSLKGELETGIGKITSISAWRFWHWEPSNDRDYTGLPITTVSANPSQQHQLSQELRLSHEGRRVDFTVGVYGFDQKVRVEGLQVQGAAASKWLLKPSTKSTDCYNTGCLAGLTSTTLINLDNASAALYGQLTWKVTDALSIQPGVRLNYDWKKGSYDAVITDGAGQIVQFAANNTAAQIAQLSQLAPESIAATYSAWNVSYDLTASYALSRDIHAYASYAHTFKSGGINLNGVPADTAGAPLTQYATVKPESVDHFEAGIKTQWFGRRATFNLDAFRTEIHNYQAIVNNGQQGALRGYVDSAPFVRVQGVEWDISLRPDPRLNAYFNGAYNDGKYLRFPNAPCPPELSGGSTPAAGQTPSAPGTVGGVSPVSCDISGLRLPGISRLTLSYGAEANVPVRLLGRGGEIYAGVDGSYRTAFSSNPSPSAYTWVAGYALTNVRAGFRADNGLDVYGWVRNAFNVEYFQQLAVAPGNTGLIAGQPGDPRTYGGPGARRIRAPDRAINPRTMMTFR
eukprot:gene4477-4523_t